MALSACYNSEMNANDIELESEERETIEKICNDFAKKYRCRVMKIDGRCSGADCYYVFHEDYGTLNIFVEKPVASLRRKFKRKVNGIMTYDVNVIFNDLMKEFNSYRFINRRTYPKMRESLEDILFIYKNYKQDLWGNSLRGIEESMAYKGVSKIDFFSKILSQLIEAKNG